MGMTGFDWSCYAREARIAGAAINKRPQPISADIQGTYALAA